MYEVTFLDSGQTIMMTEKKACKYFGKIEWLEIKQGYLPHIVAIKVD